MATKVRRCDDDPQQVTALVNQTVINFGVRGHGGMGRRERPIDPSAGPLAAFAHDLRELRQAAGSPSYRELARRTHYSDTTLSTAANGTALPSRDVTLAFVHACGGDVDQWRSRWEALYAQLSPPSVPLDVEGPTDPIAGLAIGQEPAPATAAAGRNWRTVVVGAAAVVIGLSAIAGTAALVGQPGHHRTTDHAVPAQSPTVTQPTGGVGAMTALAGAGCPEFPNINAVAVTIQPPSWSTDQEGGWTADNCNGLYVYQPHSGDALVGPNYVEWKIQGFDTRPMHCVISVFIPDSPHAAGTAHYYIWMLVDDTPRIIAKPLINQATQRGRWVDEGPYPEIGGKVRVNMYTQGADHQEIIGGPIRVTCRA